MDTMKIVMLSNNCISTSLHNWLRERGHSVKIIENLDEIYSLTSKPDLIFSYCFKQIIPCGLIEWMDGNIVNLHISYLPWNRGYSPNFWSFQDTTPQGVTLHYIDKGLDTGDIIAQALVPLSRSETFASSYNKLHQEAQRMFQNAFDQYCHWKKIARPQIGTGSYHSKKQLISRVGDMFDWNQTIADYFGDKNE